MSSVASYMQANTYQDHDPRFQNNPEDANIEGEQGKAKKFRLRLSQRLHYTSILALVSYLILLIAFASPYWLSSYKFSDSAFKRLGLWDFCFLDYRHPSYQYDTKFSGCHWIYSPVYTNIRDWLQPPWFMFVQAVTTISLCFSTLGLLAISVIFMHFLIQYQLIILCITLICHMFTAMLLSFAVVTFYLKAFDRSWIMYPQLNHVDWAFFFALVAAAGNGYSSYLYYQEVKELKQRMLKMKRLIVATNGRSLASGDLGSIDGVYAAKSASIFNQSLGHDNQGIRGQSGGRDAALGYPHFTQV